MNKNKLASLLIIIVILLLISGTAAYFILQSMGVDVVNMGRKGAAGAMAGAEDEAAEEAKRAAEEAERLRREQLEKERIEKERKEKTEALKAAHREMVRQVFADWEAWETALSLQEMARAVNYGNMSSEFRLNLTGFVEQIRTLGFDGTCRRDMENKRFALDAKLSAQNVVIASPKLTAGENTAYVRIPELLGEILLKLPLKGMGASILNSPAGTVVTEAVPQAGSFLKGLSPDPYRELAIAESYALLDRKALEKAASEMAENLAVSDWELPQGENGEWTITYPSASLTELFSLLHAAKEDFPELSAEKDPVFTVYVDEEGVLRRLAAKEAEVLVDGKTMPLKMQAEFSGKKDPASEFNVSLQTEGTADHEPIGFSMSGETDLEDLEFELSLESGGAAGKELTRSDVSSTECYLKGKIEDSVPGKSFTADIKELRVKDENGAEKQLEGKLTLTLAEDPVGINSSGALDLNALGVMDGLKLAGELSKHLEGWKRIAGYLQ